MIFRMYPRNSEDWPGLQSEEDLELTPWRLRLLGGPLHVSKRFDHFMSSNKYENINITFWILFRMCTKDLSHSDIFLCPPKQQKLVSIAFLLFKVPCCYSCLRVTQRGSSRCHRDRWKRPCVDLPNATVTCLHINNKVHYFLWNYDLISHPFLPTIRKRTLSLCLTTKILRAHSLLSCLSKCYKQTSFSGALSNYPIYLFSFLVKL